MMKKLITSFTAVTLILGLCACTTAQLEGPNSEVSQSPTWQEQYDLGIRYLSEGNYQEAILAFTAAIEIDPKQVEAYETLANAYIAIEEHGQAAQVLLSAVENCPEERVRLIGQLEQIGYAVSKDGELIPYSIPNIHFEHLGGGLDIDDEYAVITATNTVGDPVWQYTTQTFENTELPRVEEIGIANGAYYFNESGTIVALDLNSGKVVWKIATLVGRIFPLPLMKTGTCFLPDTTVRIFSGWTQREKQSNGLTRLTRAITGRNPSNVITDVLR